MKNTKNHTRWICLNLILMILLSGMCYESVKADSLLQRLHTGAIESQQTAHQLNDVFFGGPQNEGTEEVFGVRDFESRLGAEYGGKDKPYQQYPYNLFGLLSVCRYCFCSGMDQADRQDFSVASVQSADDHPLYSPEGRSQRLTIFSITIEKRI